MFHHILVPLDGTTGAEQVLPLAAHLARASGAMLTLVRIVPENVDAHGSERESYMREKLAEEKQKGRNELARLSMNVLLKGLDVESKLFVASSPASGGTDESSGAYDLILLRQHRHGDQRPSPLESFAYSVAEQRAVPLLLVSQQESEQFIKGRRGRQFRMLVVLDGSAEAEAVIRPAATLTVLLSAPQPGSLHLLCLVRSDKSFIASHDEEGYRMPPKQAWEKAQAYLEHVSRKVFREIVSNHPLAVSSSLCEMCNRDDLLKSMSRKDMSGSPSLKALAFATSESLNQAEWLLESAVELLMGDANLSLLVAPSTRAKRNERARRRELAGAGSAG